MPELYKDVLIYQAYYGIGIAHMVKPIGFNLKLPWMSPEVGKLVDDAVHPITHWMPLPEPPKDNK